MCMKKRFLVIVALIVCSLPSMGQVEDWSFGLSMGGAAPLGNYGKNDLGESKSGFADVGFFLDASAYYEVNSSFSWVGRLRFTNNPTDEREVYNKVIGNSYPEVQLAEDDSDVRFSVNDWLSGAILFGGQYRFNIYNTYLDFYGLVGAQVWVLPKHDLSTENVPNRLNTLYVEGIDKDQDVSFASMVGAAYNIPIKESIMLRFNVDWIGSNVQYSYSQNFISSVPSEEVVIEKVGEVNYSVFASSLNFGIGLVYLF